MSKIIAAVAVTAALILMTQVRLDATQGPDRPPAAAKRVSAPAAPMLIPFQGHLTRPKPGDARVYEAVRDDRYDVLFTLYTAPVGSESRVWGPERHEKLVVVNGLVNALIGSVEKGLEALKPEQLAGPIYVGVTIDADGRSGTPDLELVPRQVLLPAMYAHQSGHAKAASDSERLGGRDASSILEELKEIGKVLAANTPTGSILPYAGRKAPPGWLLCDGLVLDVVKNPDHKALMSLLGTTYDPDGKQVKLPDFRGRTPLGSGTGLGLMDRKIGSYLGSDHWFLSLAQMPAHQHSGSTGPGNAAQYLIVGNGVGLSSLSNHVTGWVGGATTKMVSDQNYPISYHTHQITTDVQGGGQAIETITPAVAIIYIIKF